MFKNLILNENENIVKIIRQSWLILIISSVLPAILTILPFFFLYLLFNWGDRGIIIFSLMLSIGFLWLIRNIIIWRSQILIITNQRIIDIDKEGIFQKTVSDIPLTKIQDVFCQTKGIGQTLIRMGNIYITLNDSRTKIKTGNVPQPQKIQQLILQLKEDELKEKLESNQPTAQELLNLVKKIKAEIGEEKFSEILKKHQDEN